MKTLLISLFLIFLAHSSMATEYTGKGKYVLGNLKTYNCNDVFFDLSSSAVELRIQNGYYDCENTHGIFLAREFEIRGEELYENNILMGQIDGNTITIKNHDPAYKLFISLEYDQLLIVESYLSTTVRKTIISILNPK